MRLETRYIDIEKSISIIDRNFHIDLYRLYRWFTATLLLTHYRPCEVWNSIYRYRKIHMDYRSNFLYRFISNISIIYGSTITLWKLQPPFELNVNDIFTKFASKVKHWNSLSFIKLSQNTEIGMNLGKIVLDLSLLCVGPHFFSYFLAIELDNSAESEHQ